MTEQKNSLAQLFAARGKNEASKAGFLADPKAVLAEYDMPVPDNLDVKVVENADDCVYITLPKRPSGELSDEELESAAGGGGAGGDGNTEMDSDAVSGLGFINSMAS